MATHLRHLRKSADISAQQLADLAGTSRQQIENLERGERKLTKEWAERLAPHLGVTAHSVMFPEVGQESGAKLKSGLKMVGVVEAGAFRIADTSGQDDEFVPLVADPRYPEDRQACWLVRGDSMDLHHIVDGMYVRGTLIEDFRQARSGDIVVVERSRDQGREIELTVKELKETQDSYLLCPKSSNKSHANIVVPKVGGNDGFITVRIVAVVTAAFKVYS